MNDAQNIVIYAAAGVELTLPLDRNRETVWASQAQMEELFGVDQSGVSRHIRNILRNAEVGQESKMQRVHIARADRPAAPYSFCVILAAAATLFVTFLSRNGILMDADGEPRISNNALAAITLLVAMSCPKEKELMVALVVRMLSEPAQ